MIRPWLAGTLIYACACLVANAKDVRGSTAIGMNAVANGFGVLAAWVILDRRDDRS